MTIAAGWRVAAQGRSRCGCAGRGLCERPDHQQLRVRLETQFGHLRTLMVAQAFSEGNLLDPSQTDGDPQTDPRGIAVSR